MFGGLRRKSSSSSLSASGLHWHCLLAQSKAAALSLLELKARQEGFVLQRTTMLVSKLMPLPPPPQRRRSLGRHHRCLNGTTRPPTPLPPEAVAVQWDAIPSENIRPSEEWSGTGGGFLIPWCTILMASPAAAVVNELRTRRC